TTSLMNLELSDKAAIVTGSSRGLGLASAKALVDEGCPVCLCARGSQTLEEAAASLRELGASSRVVAIPADLSTPQGAEAVVNGALEAFGRVDILVNNV